MPRTPERAGRRYERDNGTGGLGDSVLGINFETLRFAEPQYLWLLVVPGALLVGWFWQLAARRRDARRYRQHRRLPVRERFPIFGSLVFWLCLILASAAVIIALARPTATASLVR